jgi:hypothetical protein
MKPTAQPWAEMEDIYLWRTMKTTTPAAQALHLGRTCNDVAQRRAMLKGQHPEMIERRGGARPRRKAA